MKHFSLFIFLFSFLFAACSKEEYEQGTIQKSFSLSIEEPDFAPKSRATVTMSRYLLEMYESNLEGTLVRMENTTGEFDVEVKKGVDYICLFWADDGASYNADNLKAVKQTSETALGTAAYCARVTVNSKTFNGAITLKRAVAELSFIDKNGLTEKTNELKITCPYASAALNVGDGTVTRTAGTTTRTITGIVPPDLATDAFATDFILAPTAKGSLEGLKFQLNAEEEKTLASLAVQANFRTKITGEYEGPVPSMSFKIDTRKNTASDVSFILPLAGAFSGYDLRVYWGDGESDTFTTGTTLDANNMLHTYTTAGEYTITISSTQKDPAKQQMPKLAFGQNYNSTNSNSKKLISLNSPLLNMGVDLSSCFMDCTNLTTIPAGLFTANTAATNFSRCFYGCKGLTGAIPAGLFTANIAATYFLSCFDGCTNLTGEIPATLFTANAKATDFSRCFNGCTGLTGAIPAGMFTANTAATNFSFCFNGCTGLTEIPALLFEKNTLATNFSSCFDGCTNLTGEIPAGLFTADAKATDFSRCFNGCTGLTGAIPATLFTENAKATDFSRCFYGCTGLTGAIPATLFEKNTLATYFSSCFSGCTELTAVPELLFEKNTLATNFSFCFYGCTNLTTIPAGLFTANTKATNFSNCFRGCTGLTAVPELLFEKNTLATDFTNCFYGCTKLKLNANIFCDEMTEKDTRFKDRTIKFNFCFINCGSALTDGQGGTAPALWEYTMTSSTKTGCFTGVTKVTNVGDIPIAWGGTK